MSLSKKFVKRILWGLIGLLLAVVAWFALTAVGGLLGYFQRGADPASALNIVPNIPPDLQVKVTWQQDVADTGRKMELFTRKDLEATYLRAWLQWNLSYTKGEPYGLKTYFGGPALAAVSESITQTVGQGWKIDQADLSHRLRLNFYSADGSIVSFTDEEAQVLQILCDSKGNLQNSGLNKATYEVVMLLEDGNWRVRHWLRTDGTLQDRLPYQNPTPKAGFVQGENNQLTLNGQPYKIAGLNYYPQATPWDKFWSNYNPAIIEKDFSRIQQLGLNTVRIFIPFEQFGGAHVPTQTIASPTLTTTTPAKPSKIVPDGIKNLTDLLAKAERANLKVIVTLFDFRSDYKPLFWTHSDRQLETLLTAFKENPTILAWDIKNEPDLDYKSNSPEIVKLWLAHTLEQARRFDPAHLLTIGWSTPEAAPTLAEQVDFVSFHYYDWAEKFPARYATLQEKIAARPLVLGEFGLPTWNSFFFPGGHSEAEQAEYFANLLTTPDLKNSSGYLAWTLYDFGYVPGNVGGSWPWQKEPQKELGILRKDGSLKPSAVLLSPSANLAAVPRLPNWARFLKPFWLTLFTFGLLIIFIVFRRHRKKRN